ncbi:hypothetical protein [Orlajensenia leifsoniae]|uniref:Uncharacterized protein n=1 Tax=Orlajensenia leifsoniae TaxID=2561933 RepID=A0A4Y9QQE6_9MICO|nr:hypothetical protein [Leifsonia flava]TFV94851.1 hypothetical protein E4M00_16985 [Leifsonia flava]
MSVATSASISAAARPEEPGGYLRLGQRMQDVFGRSHDEYENEVANETLPTVYLEVAHRLVAAARTAEDFAKWKKEARLSNAGAKPLIPLTAVITLFLAHAMAGLPVTYTELATTIRRRLKHNGRELLGISHKHGTDLQWYNRVWAAVDRVVELIDPYPAPTNVILKDEAWTEFYALTQTPEYRANTDAMLDRFDDLINNILHASLDLLPRDIWDRYIGTSPSTPPRLRSRAAPTRRRREAIARTPTRSRADTDARKTTTEKELRQMPPRTRWKRQ